jgi:hypothetical protein
MIGVTVALLSSTTARAGDTDHPSASEIGVTPTEIHIAVLADVDNPIVPNVLIGARDAVQGFARYINSSCAAKDKCLAGRKLVVDFYDSALNPAQTRNGEIEACTEDFAMVGTSALFLSNLDDMRNCKDKAGATTGIPDIPFVAVGQECSDESFPIVPPALQCATKGRHPETFTDNVARAYSFTKRYGALHGIYVFTSDSATGYADQYSSGFGGLRDAFGVGKGIGSDADLKVSALAPQSAYTPIVEAMKRSGSNYGQCASQYSCTVLLRKEAALQGVADQVKVWDCSAQCYDKRFLTDGGSDVDREYVDTLFLPFYDSREQQADPMLAAFVKHTGADAVDGNGVFAWASAVAFRDAVDITVAKHGVDGLTRANLLAALRTIHKFDAGGVIAPIDLADRRTTDCHVLTQVRRGKFVRVDPPKAGTYDCSPKYRVARMLDLAGR